MEMGDRFLSYIDSNMVFAYCKTYDISFLFPCWHTPCNLFFRFRYSIMDSPSEANESWLNRNILLQNIFVNGSGRFAAIVILVCPFKFPSASWTSPHKRFSSVNPDLSALIIPQTRINEKEPPGAFLPDGSRSALT